MFIDSNKTNVDEALLVSMQTESVCYPPKKKKSENKFESAIL
jgi:hypothetical protein